MDSPTGASLSSARSTGLKRRWLRRPLAAPSGELGSAHTEAGLLLNDGPPHRFAMKVLIHRWLLATQARPSHSSAPMPT